MTKWINGAVFSFIQRRWPERIEYGSSEDCSFVVRDIPAGVKINSSLVGLNYSSLSPFAVSEIVYLCLESKILLWFVRQEPVLDTGARFIVPEGFLLAGNYSQRIDDVILITKSERTVEFIVIHAGELVSQFIKPLLNDDECNRIVSMLKREYHLDSPHLKHLSAAKRQSMLIEGMKNIGFRDLSGFWVGREKGKSELLAFAGALLPPLLLFLVLYSCIQIGGVWQQQHKLDTMKKKFAEIQQSLKPLITQRAAEEKSITFWNIFVENETAGLSLTAAYQITAESILEVGGTLIRWNGVKDHVTCTVLLEDAAALMDVFRRDTRFYSVRIDGAVRKDRKTGKERATFSIDLVKGRS